MSYFLCYDFDMEKRPAFEEIKSFEEFSKYYWYREEIVLICRQLGICAVGYKADLNKRIEEYFRESGDTSFTLGDLLEVYYERKTYACYDRVSLQWNKFVKDFCADPATARFPNKLKTAARLWKKVRESTREKVYKHELLEEFKEEYQL